VEALGTEQSPLVKVTLIDTLADFGERESVQPLLRLRASGEENSVVRERAARALDLMKSKGIKWE
jgi:HEAT repeat protein